jgi:hypothetical protein
MLRFGTAVQLEGERFGLYRLPQTFPSPRHLASGQRTHVAGRRFIQLVVHQVPPGYSSTGQAAPGRQPSLLQPGSMPATNGSLLMLGAFIAASLLTSRTTTTDQAIADSNLTAAADAYKKAEKKLIETIIEADKNDLGRNEIARRVPMAVQASADIAPQRATGSTILLNTPPSHQRTGDLASRGLGARPMCSLCAAKTTICQCLPLGRAP